MRRSADLDNKIEQLRQFYRQRCRMPSYTEIAQLFGWRSKNAVFRLVKKLKAQGIITQDEKGRLIPQKLLSPLKLLGTVEAGFPSPAE
ncbi:MAG: hypothetical protein ABIK51_04365, partial [candidate division WOR-3 bacterium]